MTGQTEFSFDGYTLRTSTGELTRDGQTRRLTQQPLRILIELLEHPGEVVSRERLVELLWPKGVVDYDNGLNVAVRKLRSVLEDDSETPRYIETLPRIGYRFVGRLETPGPAAVASPEPAIAVGKKQVPPRVWIVAGGVFVVVAAAAAWIAWREPADVPVQQAAPAAGNAAPPMVARRTTSVRAYELYLQGIYNRSRRDRNSLPLALENFEAAIAEDPEYAAAWAGLADTLVGAAVGHFLNTRQTFERSRQAALRSVELDPGIAESHTALGQVFMFFDRDYAAAEAEYAKARAANEAYGRLWHHIGSLRAFQGRADEAIAAMRRARELEPMTLLFSSNHAHVLYHAHRYDEAIAQVRPLLEATPTLDQARSVLIRALVAKGELKEAAEQLGLRRQEHPNISDAGLVYAHSGQREKALLEIERLRKASAQGFGVGYEIAVIYAALGDVPNACQAIELAWNDASPFLGWSTLDPRMDPLRSAPCFVEMQRRLQKR